ncbi:MAG: UV DNA damage repair endonuclease UvsE [Chloroflexota bacterium]|nr:UV DNA damage repair endonuclease UvsE [Chloroflexota bacterium]
MPRGRLGFAVKVLGESLPSHDTRRWQSEPHLHVSLRYLDGILDYLIAHDIRFYRMSSDLAPYLTHPDMPQFHSQIEEASEELAAIGARAREQGIRLSFHPSQYILLNAEDETIAEKSIKDLNSQAAILDAMGVGPEGTVVTHVGGVYGDKEASLQRFIERYRDLEGPACERLVVENDDKSYGIRDCQRIHDATGIPIVLDYLHYRNYNPDDTPIEEAIAIALDSWPAEVRPKMHFSSPRTEMREVTRKNPETGKRESVLQPPLNTQHSDFVNPFEFIDFARALPPDRDVDIMLEAKSKDLALLRLREELEKYAPDVAARFRGAAE